MTLDDLENNPIFTNALVIFAFNQKRKIFITHQGQKRKKKLDIQYNYNQNVKD